MTLFEREHSNLSYSLPAWKRELINRRKSSIHAGASFSTITSQCTAAAQYQHYRHKNIVQRYVTAANQRAVDHSLNRQPDFHLQLCASIRTSISTLRGSQSQSAVDNMKLLNEVGAVRDSTVKSGGARMCASSRTDHRISCENYVKHVIEMNEEKCFDKFRIRNKFNSRIMRSFSPQPAAAVEEENISDSSEELQYGPGIVNKLKTKYMSMTLRDNQKKGLRPALSNLRKSSSLDNLLENGELLDVDKRYQISSVISCVNKLEYSSKETSSCVTVNFSTDLKRARSMEALQEVKNSSPSTKSVVVSKSKVTTNCSSKPPPFFENIGLNIPLDSIINDDIIIVENSLSEVKNPEEKRRRNLPDNKELPRPDVVKERLKIFETKCHKSSVKRWRQKCPLPGKPPVLYPKPVLARKPVLKCDENGSVLKSDHRTSSSAFSSIKVNFESNQNDSRRTVSHTTSVCNETNSINVNVKTSAIINATNEGSPVVNGVACKKVANRETGVDEHKNNENECKYRGILKSNDVLPVRQIGVIRPLVSQSSKNNILPLTPQEVHKNFLNSKKTQDSEKLIVNSDTDKSLESCKDKDISNNLTNSTNSPTNAVTKPSTLCIKKAWNQQQNTMVFNFKDRKEVPDYIENDGLTKSTTNRERTKRVVQESSGIGYIILGNGTGDVADESSTDVPNISCREEWQSISGPPSPCNVYFEGDNVVINGKSNLRKHPKEKKLRIQFNDTSTTYEYPSEASLLEEVPHNSSISDEEPLPPPLYTSSPELILVPCNGSKMHSPLNGGSGLASYVPCKLGMGKIFQLGVTKSKNNSAVSHPNGQSIASSLPNGGEANLSSESCISTQENTTDEEDDYLKPADETENVVWSEESIPDLLF